jgi:hypothetical protein
MTTDFFENACDGPLGPPAEGPSLDLAHLIEVPSEEILAATEEDVRRASAWYGQKPTDAAARLGSLDRYRGGTRGR